MTANQWVADLLHQMRQNAKFIAVKHSSEFIDPAAELGSGFFYANLYDEEINANLYKTNPGYILIENTYISSFAYNLFFCWLFCHEYGASSARRDELLLHNLKKFGAEQLYRLRNSTSSRALLLETLLYEERQMHEVFVTQETNPALADLALKSGAGIMNFLLTQHEFGHYIAETKPETWEALLQSGPASAGELLLRASERLSGDSLMELKCDVFAVYNCLRNFGTEPNPTFVLRAISFAYAAYAAMYSVSASAKSTSDLWEAEANEEVDFLDIASWQHVDYPIDVALDEEFVERARLVLQVCGEVARDRGLPLYGEEHPFPLFPTILQDLLNFVPKVFDCADSNARRMSRLVARAFHGHTEGMEYLYLRSKTFRTNRQEPLEL